MSFSRPTRETTLTPSPSTASLTRPIQAAASGYARALSQSGPRPSISRFLSGKIEMSDGQLDRLLSCMGRRLEVTWRPVVPDLTRSERRSWRLHSKISSHLTESNLGEWHPTIKSNLQRLSRSVRGEPHKRNLDRWNSLVEHGDVQGLHRILTGLDRDSIEMREVSPMGGLLSESERKDILQAAN
jgi:hypothetical protein